MLLPTLEPVDRGERRAFQPRQAGRRGDEGVVWLANHTEVSSTVPPAAGTVSSPARSTRRGALGADHHDVLARGARRDVDGVDDVAHARSVWVKPCCRHARAHLAALPMQLTVDVM